MKRTYTISFDKLKIPFGQRQILMVCGRNILERCFYSDPSGDIWRESQSPRHVEGRCETYLHTITYHVTYNLCFSGVWTDAADFITAFQCIVDTAVTFKQIEEGLYSYDKAMITPYNPSPEDSCKTLDLEPRYKKKSADLEPRHKKKSAIPYYSYSGPSYYALRIEVLDEDS